MIQHLSLGKQTLKKDNIYNYNIEHMLYIYIIQLWYHWYRSNTATIYFLRVFLE